MRTTQTSQLTSPELFRVSQDVDVASSGRDRDAVYHELARLESAHEQLLRYAQDLKQAYEAERERRAMLARATLDLMTVLATALTADETA